VGFAFSGSGFGSRFALGETIRFVAGFDYAAVVGDPIKQRGGHLGISKDRDAFAKLEVGRGDDADGFIQLANEMKQQRPAATAIGVQAIEHNRRKVCFYSTVERVNALELEKTPGRPGSRLRC
jgi:hypothetical protein